MSARRVIDFDHHAASLALDPFSEYEQLRTRCPVAYSEKWGGFWVVSDYASVCRVALDDDVFRSGEGVSLPTVGQHRRLIPIEIDPPAFFDYRRLLNPLFSPARVAEREEMIGQVTRDVLSGLWGRRDVDLVAEYAKVVPARVALSIIGLPQTKLEFFLDQLDIVHNESALNLEKAVDALIECYSAIAEGLDARQTGEEPGDPEDLLNVLLQARIRGEPLTEEAMLDTVMLILMAGLDTTASLIGEVLLDLGLRPDERKRLIDAPQGLPRAIEEYARYVSPVQGLARTVARDVEVDGQMMRPGDKVWVLWAAANRDPKEFDDPDTLCRDRMVNRHLAFGIGIHRCLGMHLARTLAKVCLEEFLMWYPDYTLGPEPFVRVEDCSVVYGLKSLPVQLGEGSAFALEQGRTRQ